MSFTEYNFSELLKQFRVRERLNQHELAKRMGVHRNTIVSWEQGSYLPKTRPRVLELAQVLHLNEQDTEQLLHASFLSTSEEHQTPATITHSQPAQLWNVPYRRNPYFTGRDELLHLIEQHLSVAEQDELTTTRLAALTQPQAIKGLGGIGKTQIAVEYAYRAREQDQYTHTLWMNAASKETLMTSFTAFAELLPEFPAKNETDQKKLVEAIKRWLEQCQQRWLLIFDNADDLSLIQEYFPKHGNGSILLTTRANAVGSLATSIEVEKMGFVEGTHLLLRRAQRFAQASDEQINWDLTIPIQPLRSATWGSPIGYRGSTLRQIPSISVLCISMSRPWDLTIPIRPLRFTDWDPSTGSRASILRQSLSFNTLSLFANVS